MSVKLKFVDKLRSFSLLKKISILYILFFATFLVIYVTQTMSPNYPECDSYMLPMISLQYRGSIEINQSDIDRAREDIPYIYKNVYTYEDLPSSNNLFIANNGNWYSFYFITYSVACLPLKLLLQILSLNQVYACMLTNVLIYIIALFVVLFKLKCPDKIKLITILLLSINPILFYFHWISMEVFVFSMVVISLVYLVNLEYKRSALFVSIAGSMNPTIMVLGMAIILLYFLMGCKEYKNIVILIKKKFKDIAMFGCCFIPCLIPFAFNLIVFGELTPTSSMAQSLYLGERFIAYIFDLNMGLFPYFPILLILFFMFSLYGLWKRDFETICYNVAFWGTICAFSIAFHINSGMTVIARYNSWVSPIMIFYLTCNSPKFLNRVKLKKIYNSLLICSVVFSIIILGAFQLLYTGLHPHYHTPLAKLVLNTFPQLYNPFYATFISRTTHIDGGYTYKEPVIYIDEESKVFRKILVTGDTSMEILNDISGNDKSIEWLRTEIEKAMTKDSFSYINIPMYSSIVLKEKVSPNFDSQNYDEKSLIKGIYWNENGFNWCSNDVAMALMVANKLESGLRVNYTTMGALFTANPNTKLKTDVLVDDILVETIDHLEPGNFAVYIDADKLPKKDAEEQFVIRLKTNGYFVPGLMPEVFGVGNNDSRKLSFQLYYLGE